MKTSIYILTGLLLLASCINKQPSKDTIETQSSISLDFSQQEEVLPVSKFVDSIQTIPLYLPDNEAIGRPSQICFSRDFFFIKDGQQQTIFCFKKDGTFYHKIDKIGQGPQDYARISRIMTDDNAQILYVYDNISSKINAYTFDGTFIQSISVQENMSNIELLPDHSFLCFTPDFLYNGPLGLWKMTKDGKREKIILEYTEKYPILMANWNAFYPISSKEVGIACPATNRFLIYDIEKGNVKTELSYDIKQNSIRSFPGIDNPIHVKGSFWACPIFACSTNYIFGIWTEYNGQPEGVYSLCDKKEKKINCYKIIKDDMQNNPYIGELMPANIPNAFVSFYPEEDETNTLSCLRIYYMK